MCLCEKEDDSRTICDENTWLNHVIHSCVCFYFLSGRWKIKSSISQTGRVKSHALLGEARRWVPNFLGQIAVVRYNEKSCCSHIQSPHRKETGFWQTFVPLPPHLHVLLYQVEGQLGAPPLCRAGADVAGGGGGVITSVQGLGFKVYDSGRAAEFWHAWRSHVQIRVRVQVRVWGQGQVQV